jgi:hypothetical protein
VVRGVEGGKEGKELEEGDSVEDLATGLAEERHKGGTTTD